MYLDRPFLYRSLRLVCVCLGYLLYLCLICIYLGHLLYLHLMCVLFGSSTPFASGLPVPGFSALMSSSGCLPMLGSSISLPPSTSSVCVPRLYAPSTSGMRVSTLSISNMRVPGLSALSAFGVSMSGSSPPESSLPFLIWLSPQTPMLFPEK